MDVKTAFLQSQLEEEVYLKQPDGFVDKSRPDYVCKLKKSIYGLKQAARCWNNSKINFVIIAIYVDDMIFLSNDLQITKEEKSAIGEQFQVEDLGEIHVTSKYFHV